MSYSSFRSEPTVIVRNATCRIVVAPLVPPTAGDWSDLGGEHDKNFSRPISVAQQQQEEGGGSGGVAAVGVSEEDIQRAQAAAVVPPEECAKQILAPWRKACQFPVPPESEVMVQSTTAKVHYNRLRFGLQFRSHGQYKLNSEVPCSSDLEKAIIDAGGKKEKFSVLSGHFNNADNFSMRLRVHGDASAMPRICKRYTERTHSKYKLPFLRSYSDLDGYIVGAEQPYLEEWKPSSKEDTTPMEKAKALASLFKLSRDSIGKVTQESVPAVNRFTKMELIDVTRYRLPVASMQKDDGVSANDASSTEMIFEFESGKNPLRFNQDDQYTTIKLETEETNPNPQPASATTGGEGEPKEGAATDVVVENKLAWKTIHGVFQLSSCEDTRKGKPSNSAANNQAKLECLFKVLNFSGYRPPSLAHLPTMGVEEGATSTGTSAVVDGASSIGVGQSGMSRTSIILTPENLVWDNLKLHYVRSSELLGRKTSGLHVIYAGSSSGGSSAAAPKYDPKKLLTTTQEKQLQSTMIQSLKANKAEQGKVDVTWQLGKAVMVAEGDPHASFGGRTNTKGTLNFFRGNEGFFKRNGISLQLVVNGHKLKFIEEGESKHQVTEHVERMSRCVLFRPNGKADLNVELCKKDQPLSSVFPDDKDVEAINKVAADMIYQLRRCVRRDDMDAANNLQVPNNLKDANGEPLNFDIHYEWGKELVFTWAKTGWSYVIQHHGRYATQQLRFEAPGDFDGSDDRFCKKQHQFADELLAGCYKKEVGGEGEGTWQVDALVEQAKSALRFLDTVDPPRASSELLVSTLIETAEEEEDSPQKVDNESKVEEAVILEAGNPPLTKEVDVKNKGDEAVVTDIKKAVVEVEHPRPTSRFGKKTLTEAKSEKVIKETDRSKTLRCPQFDLRTFIKVHLGVGGASNEAAARIHLHLQEEYGINSVNDLYNSAGAGEGTALTSDPALGGLFRGSVGHHSADTVLRYHTTQTMMIGDLPDPAVVIGAGAVADPQQFPMPWSRDQTTLLLPYLDGHVLEEKVLPQLLGVQGIQESDMYLDREAMLIAIPNSFSKQLGVGFLQSESSLNQGFFNAAVPPSVLFTLQGTAVPVVPTPLPVASSSPRHRNSLNKIGFSILKTAAHSSSQALPECAPLFYKGLLAGICRGKARTITSPRLKFTKK